MAARTIPMPPSTPGAGAKERTAKILRSAAFATLALLAAVSFGGCAGDVRVVSLVQRPGAAFSFSTRTNTLMTANDDGAAERIRRDWLADALVSSGTCRTGYVLDGRRFVQPQGGVFGNGGEIVYAGHCL